MKTTNKYCIEKLEWQQFEILAFKCIQLDMSNSLSFIEGGSDKGRDFVFSGQSDFFGLNGQEYKYLFQAKHKSQKESFSSLNDDLKSELEKVYIKEQLDYNFYCLVTNIIITGKQHDILHDTFSNFITSNGLPTTMKFGLYSYRNLEACIEKNDFLKWMFPSIVSQADFKMLIESIVEKNAKNITEGWLSVFEKNKANFVCSTVFEKALSKLEENNILLLSGPSKSGKTFNAEMLLFNRFCIDFFTPYKIDKTEDFERYYDKNKNQIFLFDDAFGKYNVDPYRADSFNRKLEYIFELVDDKHKCIFTSREYIYQGFLGYADADVKAFITKIVVDVNDLTVGEKESIFLRYFKNSKSHELSLSDSQLLTIVSHKNFSPEIVRSYFTNNSIYEASSFLKHLENPDEYLEKDFNNLSEENKTVLLATLLSINPKVDSIGYSHGKVCEDLNKQYLVSVNSVLNQLDGSILKGTEEGYTFYHPSMFEFFVRYISKDTSIYRKIVLNNLNTKLLNVISFNPSQKSHSLKIAVSDLSSLSEGFKRIIDNPFLSLDDLNTVLSWISSFDIQLNLKLPFPDQYSKFRTELAFKFSSRSYLPFVNENIYTIADFLKKFSNDFTDITIDEVFLKRLIETYRHDNNFWLLVFRVIPLLPKDVIFQNISRDWFNVFLKNLEREIDLLGFELYGEYYPDFTEVKNYEKLIEEKKFKEARNMKIKQRADYKKDTGRTWYPRYVSCKEKMNILKTSHPYGFKLYERLIVKFGHLQALETNQFNRYKFIKKKKWW